MAVRMQASIAVSSDGDHWLLVNATTDIRRQMELLPPQPSAPARGTPVTAVLLTDANIDHAGGLLELRQSPVTRIFSSAQVRDALAGANPIFAPFARGDRRWSVFDASLNETSVADVGPDLRVTAIDVPGLMPSFAGGAESRGAATAFVIEEPATQARVLYSPVFLRPNDALVAAAQRCDAVFLDGSFWSDDELPAHGLGERTARQMGHAPIGGENGWLKTFGMVNGAVRSHRYCTHVNNSNPVLDPQSAEARVLRDAGYALPDDGMELDLGAR